MKLYGDKISGNCLKTLWTADYLGLDYEWIEMDILAGAARAQEFLALNPMGQTPVLELDDGRVLSQSNAIILYLAETANSALSPADAFQRAEMMQWLFWEQHRHEPAIAERRYHKFCLNKPDSEIDPNYMLKGNAALALMERHLASNDFFIGEAFSLADIALLAYTRMAPDGGFDLAQFPNIVAWIERSEQKLNLDPYRPD